MSELDIDQCYEHATKCAEQLNLALLLDFPARKNRVARARRYLARATTAFGEPAVGHQRRVRRCRQALEALEKSIVAFETEAPIDELLKAVRKSDRCLREVQIATLSDA